MKKSFQFFIFNLSVAILLFLPFMAQGALLYLTPQEQSVYQGESFVVEMRLDTEGEEINAVGASLAFPADILEAVNFDKGGSILTLWPEEPQISDGGFVVFSAGMPGGFKGDGLLGKVTFLGKEAGKAKVFFKDDSKALLNDGAGTAANLNKIEGIFDIVFRPDGLPQIISKTHPDQNKWHKETTLQVYWELAEGVEYSYLLSYDPLAEPDEVADKPEGELAWIGAMEYRDLPDDGIYYFTLRQKSSGGEWSGTVRFRAKIDREAPEDFKPKVTEIDGKKYLVFAATDKTSGIDKYEVQEAGKKIFGGGEKVEWVTAKSPYLLKDQKLGSMIRVRAVDKAGNERIAEILPPEKPIRGSSIFIIILLAATALAAIVFILRLILRAGKIPKKP